MTPHEHTGMKSRDGYIYICEMTPHEHTGMKSRDGSVEKASGRHSHGGWLVHVATLFCVVTMRTSRLGSGRTGH
jgi:hypothetical protein